MICRDHVLLNQCVACTRGRGSRMLLQHIFRAYARRIGIDGQRIDLRFISRLSGRPVEIGHPPLSLRFVSHAFSLLPVSAAPFVVRVSHASSRGVIHLSTRSCSHSTPARDADSHSTTRRLAHRNFSLSIRALFFSSSFTLSCDMCAKSESRLAAIGYYLRQNGDEREEASIRHILRSLRIPSTISEFMRIWPRGEVDATFQSAKFRPPRASLTRLMNCGVYWKTGSLIRNEKRKR